MTYPDRIPALRERIAHFKDPAMTALGEYLLAVPGFATCSGSCKEVHHHYGTGGLQQHTWEVVTLCMQNEALLFSWGKPTDPKALFLAAAYHDIGKLWDYELDPGYPAGLQPGFWRGTPHKRLIHHISRSALIWSAAVRETGQGSHWEDDVLHAILSHHGQREWGSPVAPKTRLAWLLHLSDQISARGDDCDRLDVVKG